MKLRVAALAPVMPPDTGASSMEGAEARHPLKGRACLCRGVVLAAFAMAWAVGGSMVEESMSREGCSPPVCKRVEYSLKCCVLGLALRCSHA